MIMSNLAEMERLYVRAKRRYYAGDPIMTDAEFDDIEAALKAEGSKIVGMVGTDEEWEVPHLRPMLSLDKVNPTKDSSGFRSPDLEIAAWALKLGPLVEVTPKYDGVSCSIVYEAGHLCWAATRGSGTHGTDITTKVTMMGVPLTVRSKAHLELRGEILCSVTAWDKHFSTTYRNQRNIVGGILGRKDSYDDAKHLTFVAFEIYDLGESEYLDPTSIPTIFPGIRAADIQTVDATGAVAAYERMRQGRASSEHQLDGMVMKAAAKDRAEMGEASHHPRWAVAVKFPPVERSTTIRSIEWSPGSQGALTPVAIIDPIDLDGSTVSRVSLYNLRSVREKGLWPGAKVAVVKSGDIIPKVTDIFQTSSTVTVPYSCPSCGSVLEHAEVELMCNSPRCPDKIRGKLLKSMTALGVKGIGPSIVDTLTLAGILRVEDLYGPLFTKEHLTRKWFADGRQLEIVLDAVRSVKRLELWQVYEAMQMDDVGTTISKEVAKWQGPAFNGDGHGAADFTGLNSAAVKRACSEEATGRVLDLIRVMTVKGVRVVLPDVATPATGIPVELTGSPKPTWATKEDFLAACGGRLRQAPLGKGGAQYLVTDDPSGTSSKMKKAAALGVKVITYLEASKLA